MDTAFTAALLVIFLIHLAAFGFLGVRRRQVYYVSLVVTFSLLSAAMATRLFAPDAAAGDGVALHEALRGAAWAAAAVSIVWTVARIRARRRLRRRSAEP